METVVSVMYFPCRGQDLLLGASILLTQFPEEGQSGRPVPAFMKVLHSATGLQRHILQIISLPRAFVSAL